MIRATHRYTWYDTRDRPLEKLFKDNLIYTEESSKNGVCKGVISPHAGYVYCSDTALSVYKNINPELYNRVVVMGPSHCKYLERNAVINCSQMETPFGNINVDSVAHELVKTHNDCFEYISISEAEQEHSVELMLPYIKYIFKNKDITIIPIIVGSLTNKKLLDKTSDVIASLIKDDKTLMVISSDFTHWGKRFGFTYLEPMEKPFWERISYLDHKAMDIISEKDPEKFMKFCSSTKITICGRVPITIAMLALNKTSGYKVEWPHYSQSSHVQSMSDSSVSYAGGVFRTLVP